MKILTNSRDDFIYERILKLLYEVKLVRGGTDLAYTLRNHKRIRDYCKAKQSSALLSIEDEFFNPDGSLNSSSIDNFYNSRPLQ